MFALTMLSAVLLLSAQSATEVSVAGSGRTLSPYFLIEGDAGGRGREGRDQTGGSESGASDPRGGDPRAAAPRGVDAFPLLSTDVRVHITGTVAEVQVRQRYKNDGQRPLNARYVFPGSVRAAIHGLSMRIGEREVLAVIQEREQAKQTFKAAQRAGKSASLLEQERPNVFSMRLANVMPGDLIEVTLDYTELLLPTDGVYEFVYPTVVGPRYAGEGGPGESWISNPYLDQGVASPASFALGAALSTGLPLHDLACPSHDVTVDWRDESSAQIELDPRASDGGNRDVVLRYRLAGEAIASGLLLHEGPDENTFLLTVQPPARVDASAVVPREFVFLMDVSGSMDGFPLDVSKTLMRDLVSNLSPVDRFNLVLFAGAASVMSPTSVPATQEHLDDALALIDRQTGGGGTELASAIQQALTLPRSEGMSRSVIVLTDGYVSAEASCFQAITGALVDANVFAFGIGSSVNRYLVEGVARAGQGESFVVTDARQAANVAQRFRRYVSQPVLAGIRVQAQGVDVFDMEPPLVADMLAERPVVIVGKWRGERAGTLTLTGTSGAGPWSQSFDLSTAEPRPEHGALPLLWARRRIARLSDWNFGSPGMEQIQQATSLGLTYGLLTRWTSFVAVDQLVRNPAGDAVDVTQPLPLPMGVPNTAVGGGGGAEPGVIEMIVLTLLCLATWIAWSISMERRQQRVAQA